MRFVSLVPLAFAALGVLAVPLTGCAVHTGEPVGYAEIDSAPVEVESSPYVVYEGRPTYWYRDHWYYREGPRWRVYHHEPQVLYRQRPVARAVVGRPAGPPPVIARPGPAVPPPVVARPIAPAAPAPMARPGSRPPVVAH